METVKQELENLKKEMEMLKAAVSHLTDGHSATGAKTPPSAPVREPHPEPAASPTSAFLLQAGDSPTGSAARSARTT